MNNYASLFVFDGNLELKSWLFSLSGSAHCCPEHFGWVCYAEFYVNKFFFNFKKWLLHHEAMKINGGW